MMLNFKLNKLKLSNYREFGNINIDFHPEMTVLVARNGGGKTAVLDAIAVAFGPFIGAFSDGHGVHFRVSDIRQSLNLGGKEIEFHTPLKMEASGIIGEKKLEWTRELSGKKSRTTISGARNLITCARELEARISKEKKTVLPLFAYYGTGRLWKTIKLTEGKAKASKRRARVAGYMECLDPASSYNAAADWMYYAYMRNVESFLEDETAGKQSAPYEAEIEAIVEATNICLRHSGRKNLRYTIQYGELTLWHDEFGRLPVSYLSDGIRNIVGLALDIAYRAAKLNAWMGNCCVAETPGIVMIDEVDMHLHPSWQQEVLPRLSEAFPLVQFIVTTHSPQVLTTVKPECIRIISVEDKEDGKYNVIIPPFSLGAESNLVLEMVQNVLARPSQLPIVRKLHQYLKLVNSDQWDSSDALKLRKDLDEWGAGHEPVLAKTDVDIRVREYRREQVVRRNEKN